jgi:hypothetical protein
MVADSGIYELPLIAATTFLTALVSEMSKASSADKALVFT